MLFFRRIYLMMTDIFPKYRMKNRNHPYHLVKNCMYLSSMKILCRELTYQFAIPYITIKQTPIIAKMYIPQYIVL